MSNIIEGLLYTEDHEWIKVDGDSATVGITDFAQSSLGDIVFVELPDSDEEFEAEGTFGVVESIKSVSDLYSPISGKVIAKNSDIEESPELINSAPYDSWLIKVEISNKSDLDKLMDFHKYKEFCNEN